MSIIPLSGFAFFRDSGRKSLAYIQFVVGVNSSLPYYHPRPNSTRSSLTSSVDFQYMLPSVVENAPLSLGKRPLLPKPPPTQYLSFSSISTIVSIVVIRIRGRYPFTLANSSLFQQVSSTSIRVVFLQKFLNRKNLAF